MHGQNLSMWFPFVVDMAFKGTLILGTAWLVSLTMRRNSAAARHVVWTAAFVALIALPVLSAILPAVTVPVNGNSPASVLFRTSAIVTAPAPAATAGAPIGRSAGSPPPSPWRPDWRGTVVLLWCAGAVFAMARMLGGWIRMVLAYRSARPFASPLDPPPGVEVLQAPAGAMPAAFGLFRPAVLLPADAGTWDPGRLRMVLLHEFAHIRRGDAATHLVARFALNLFWWNPLAWTAWREFIKERERAADDLVLSAGARASDYAGHLVEIARTLHSRSAAGWAAVSMARRSQLEGRLLAILDSGTNRSVAGRATLCAGVLLAVALAAPFAAVRAQDNSGPQSPATDDAVIRAAAEQGNYQVLDTAAKGAMARHQYELARKLLMVSLTLRARAAGEQSATYATGLINLADLAANHGKAGEAVDYYTKAVAAASSGPEAAQALMNLGILSLKKNPEQAQQYFERAQTAGPADAGLLKMWTAVLRAQQNNAQEADSLFQQAIELEAPDSAAAATILEVHSQFLSRQNRTAESAVNAQRAETIRTALGKPAASNRRAGVARIGNGISAPKLITKVEPDYTEAARAASLTGTVILYVEIAPDGIPQNLTIVRGLGLGLEDKAMEAIAQWRFQPGMKDGEPVTVAAQIEINFRLL